MSSVAFLCGIPQGAAGPESGVETPNLMTSCAREIPGANAISASTVRSDAQSTERFDLIATPPRLGVRPEGQAHADYRNVDQACQWGTVVKGASLIGSPASGIVGRGR